MADTVVVTKVLDALTSTECLAAFLGAFAAFLLEAMRRWRSERLANLAAGNEAVFALSQMYTLMTTLHNQMFVDRAVEVRNLLGRDPLYLEYLPMEAGTADVLRLPKDRLGFLLRSYDPDVLNRASVCDREFGVLLRLLEQRNVAHVQWQQASGPIAQMLGSQQITIQQMENAVGPDLSRRLRAMTEALQSGFPRCASDLKTVADQLTHVLQMTFPTRSVSRFEAVERMNATSLPASTARPRVWRRVVRWCCQLARRPVRWPRAKAG